ncbi:MAG: hypothetical protein Tsb008_02700 [Rhodothalassiaceae bacterium]
MRSYCLWSQAALFLALGLSFPGDTAHGQSNEILSDFLACDALSGPTERLACYDATMRQYKLKYGLLENNAESVAAAQSTVDRTVENEQIDTRRRPETGVEGWGAARSGDARDGNSVGRQPALQSPHVLPDEFSAHIIRTWREGYDQLVELDNGSVWRGSGGIALRVSGNEEVRVFKGAFGNMRMKIGDSGRVVSVSRVR